MSRNMSWGSKLGAILAVLGSAGCSSDPTVDIGDGKQGEALSDYADVWDGYAEAFQFADGSDRVRITLDAQGNGFLEVGETAAAPPDPTPGGPPPSFKGSELIAGFAYPIAGAGVEQKRLRLQVQHYSRFDAWCQEQPAVLFDPNQSPDVYSCFPYTSGLEGLDTEGENCLVTGTSQVVPCQLQPACTHMCECTASGCQGGPATAGLALPSPFSFGPAQLDAALADGGETLTGTLVSDSREGVLTPRITIRLERQ